MVKVTVAPNVTPFDSGYQVFLAGAIDMGKAVDWQAQVIDMLQDCRNMSIYNPRRKEAFTPDMLDEQIKWELKRLDAADRIFMWFPRESLAPISFFEAGLFWNSDKLIVGAEQGFYRRRNLEITMQHYLGDVGTVYDNLDDMVNELMFAYSVWCAEYNKG